MIVLVINCGSSSIKYQLFDMPEKTVLAKGIVERVGSADALLTHSVGDTKHTLQIEAPDHKQGMDALLKALTDPEMGVIKDLSEIKAAGHRVVHGGEDYSGAVVIDEKVIECIKKNADLAPLHNPPNLTGIEAAQKALPGVPMVAVFDTAFHQSIPEHAYMYGLPYELYEKYRIRKYGFHGTSHAYVTHRAAELLGKPVSEVNVITCHLGNGCSMAAVQNGKAIDTTMGMTPLAGNIMGTRCGDIDPAIIFYLLGKEEYADYHDIDNMMNKKSGLLGISGKTNDMRDLKAAAFAGDARCKLALDMFTYRVSFYIGAYMGILDRVDAVIFTGGIGENGPIVRNMSCKPLANIGVTLDEETNKGLPRGEEGDIASAESPVRVFVIPTDEEGWIATETFELCS